MSVINKLVLRDTDFLRLYAIVGVVLIHVASPGLQTLFAVNSIYWVSGLWDAYARAAVPVFFMITGYIFLNRQDSIVDVLQRTWGRILIPLFFWSLIYIVFSAWFEHRVIDLSYFKKILAGPVYFHLWYLYAVFFIYLSLPVLQKISGRDLQVYFVVVWFFFFSLVPVLKKLNLTHASLEHYYTFFSGYLGYVFLGKLLGDVKLSSRIFMTSLAGVLLFPLLIALSTYLLSLHQGQVDVFFTGYSRPFTVLYACFVFLFLRFLHFYLQGKLSDGVVRVIASIAECSFGIYVVHILFYRFFTNGPSWAVIGMRDNPFFAIVLKSLIIFLISWGVVWWLRRYSVFRRVV